MLWTNIIFLHLVLLVLVTPRSRVEAQEFNPPASDFTRHSIVQPLLLHGRTKREITTTRDTNGEHHAEVTMKVPIDGEEYILDLRLNQDLVTDNHVLSYQENGNTVLHKPKKEDIDLCHYSGAVRDKPGSWVAVSTCHGVKGIVFDGKKTKYIEPLQGDINAEHYIYDHSDLTESHPRRYTYGLSNSSQHNLQISKTNRFKRNAPNDQLVRAPYQANERSLYVELVLVADRRHFAAHNNDLRSVHKEMKTLANLINAVYSSLNIYIALVGVVIWNDYDEIHLQADSLTILNNFLKYRRTTLTKKGILNDNAFLITHQKFEGSVIGKAPIRTICTHESSGGIANVHTKVTGLLAMTIAHELGHNFGMDHDDENKNTKCKCEEEKCIMSSVSTGYIPVGWSSCSLNALVLTFSKGLDYCLRNKPKRLFDSPTCGNGFVEPGEQCDCGTMAVVDVYNICHSCCDPWTCKLRVNATCGTGLCCDLQTCRPKSATTVCRSAKRECDLPEYCTGDSEYCPDDLHKMDTTPCGYGELSAYCVHGRCRSHLDQCRVLWGPTGKICPKHSQLSMGSMYGDCGYDRVHEIYQKCEPPNVMCGRLMCSHLSESTNKLQFGSMGSSDKVTNIIERTQERITTCQTASIDLGLSVEDFGMVPDGAKCGDGRMCLKQQCVLVSALRERISRIPSSVCPSDCSGHGVCNSAGHCHCEEGFAPPLCVEPGAGGSYDSGPASDVNILRRFMVSMYVIFLGIVPMVALILISIYCWRNNGFAWCKRKLNLKLTTHFKSRRIIVNNYKKRNGNAEDNSTSTKNNETVRDCCSSTIYANIEKITIKKTPSKMLDVIENEKKISYPRPLKTRNKSNIQVSGSEITKPKPNLDKVGSNNRPSIVHIKGLNSTTNEMLENIPVSNHNLSNKDRFKK